MTHAERAKEHRRITRRSRRARDWRRELQRRVKAAKGTAGPWAAGSKHFIAQLTERSVAAMRRAHYAGGVSISDLALKYNVGYRSAWAAVTGRTWKHVPPYKPAA